ncbi:MAG: hypothetical protein B7Z10_08215 [Rhodobacterales bacterium 32-66-7]|nr:MAG: hypothetical protein B7Z10_08215 [Rhodobacterales bacterium 32-66-7]
MAVQQVQIKCINKSDRMNAWERITHVGGFTDRQWKITQEQAIKHIEASEWQFYVTVGGKSIWVIVAESRFGNKYLKTQADNGEANNLLSLPECP